MNARARLGFLLVVFLVMNITACGKGKAGGDGRVEYSGITTPATLSGTNAHLFFAEIVGGVAGDVAQRKPSAKATGNAFRQAVRQKAVNAYKGLGLRKTLSRREVINETENCEVSGSLRVTGNIANDGTGTLDFFYNQCVDSEGRIHGNMHFVVTEYDLMSGDILKGTITFDYIEFEDATDNVAMTGELKMEVDQENLRVVFTSNVTYQNKKANRLVKLEAMVDVNRFDGWLGSDSYWKTLSGRLYIATEGYIEMSTPEEVHFDTSQQPFPLEGGPLLIKGAQNGSAKLIVVTDSERARVELDTDGDGVPEFVAVYAWQNIGGAALPNAAPKAAAVNILPEDAGTLDDLSVEVVDVRDDDGDAIEYSYLWQLNDSPVPGQTGNSLSSDLFVKGDVISVTVTLYDGKETVEISSAVLTVQDTPFMFDAVGELSLDYGAPLTTQITGTDSDGDTPAFSLSYAPQGMQIDPATGELTWTPKNLLLDDEVTVHFGVKAGTGDISGEYEGSVRVKGNAMSRPLVRSEWRVAFGSHGNQQFVSLADFDGNGQDEILLSDHEKLLYTLAWDGAEYSQQWVYPFDLGGGGHIRAVTHADFNNNDKPDMLVATSTKVVVIDGESKEVIAQSAELFVDQNAIRVGDVDNDGSLEIVTLGYIKETEFLNSQRLTILDAGSFEVEWQSAPLSMEEGFNLGNVDDDPALELVTHKGFVFDGATHANQWAYGEGFGEAVAVGDVDGDGVDEIVGVSNFQPLKVYSAVAEDVLWKIDFSTLVYDNLVVQNIDGDAQEEIVVGQGQTIVAYDGVSGQGVLEWTLNLELFSSAGLAIGNLDGDPSIEVFCIESNNVFTVMSPDQEAPLDWRLDTNQHLRGYFGHPVVADTAEGQKNVVFKIGGHGSARLGVLDANTGTASARPLPGNIFNTAGSILVNDYDNDGSDDLFINYSDWLVAYDMVGDVIDWFSPPDGGYRRYTAQGDMDGDSHTDVVTVDFSNYIHVHDVFGEKVLWKSPNPVTNASVSALAVADLDGDEVLEIVVATYGDLQVYSRSGLEYVSSGTIEGHFITDMQIGDIDGDGQPEIMAMVESGGGSKVILYDGKTLAQKGDYVVEGAVYDLQLHAIPDERPLLYVAHQLLQSPSSSSYGYHISALNAVDGRVIWTSPRLNGELFLDSVSLADADGDGAVNLIYTTPYTINVAP